MTDTLAFLFNSFSFKVQLFLNIALDIMILISKQTNTRLLDTSKQPVSELFHDQLSLVNFLSQKICNFKNTKLVWNLEKVEFLDENL